MQHTVESHRRRRQSIIHSGIFLPLRLLALRAAPVGHGVRRGLFRDLLGLELDREQLSALLGLLLLEPLLLGLGRLLQGLVRERRRREVVVPRAVHAGVVIGVRAAAVAPVLGEELRERLACRLLLLGRV